LSRIPKSLAELIGGTPLVSLSGLAEGLGGELIGKLEAYNPAGSVKDRIGLAMIEAAERGDEIAPGRTTIIESTSGNTGIALAFVCAARGYSMVLTMPEGMSRERQKLLEMYGAQVVITESMGGMDQALAEAERLAARIDGSYQTRQFENPANPEAHRRTTAEEIWGGLDGRVDAFVAGVGTGGTITGVGQVLKARRPAVQIVAVEPAGSAVLSGGRPGHHNIQGIGAGFVPQVLDRELLDEVIQVSDDEAVAACQALARREGILAGMSSGAAVHAALSVVARPEMRGKRVVVMLPDSGERYISAPFFGPGAD
jgi:cysteine synthase